MKNKDQERIEEDIQQLFSHADIANREVGLIQKDISILKNDIAWIKDLVNKLDTRTLAIISMLILGIVTQIAFFLAK